MRYFCLPREIVESIQNFPPTKEVSRPVTFVLKDGSVRTDVVVINSEFYGMDETKHKYFEPSDISMATEN
jgi:high-affinity K+ transport system ATPase subunit B